MGAARTILVRISNQIILIVEIQELICHFQSKIENFSKEINFEYSGAYLWNEFPLFSNNQAQFSNSKVV